MVDAVNIFPSTAESYGTNGLGALTDAISCIVTEELNGMFELEMRYPIFGQHFSDIGLRSIITAKSNPTGDPQPFRIYRITKPLNGIVTIYARHIAYDMAGIAISPFTASTLGTALVGIREHAVGDFPFTLGTDKSVSSGFTVKEPRSMWSLIGGEQGSLLDVYGGEWEFNGFSAYLWQRRGYDRGVTIRYGKNLRDLEQDSECSNVYTGVYPYWADPNSQQVIELPEKVVEAPGTYDYEKILTLNFSDSFETAPTEAQLRSRAEAYIQSNNIGVPSVSLNVSFEMLEQSDEYKGMALLERVYLGDTVTVIFDELGVNATARAVKIVFNPLLNRYDSITLGKTKSNFAQTIVTQQKEIEEKPSRTIVSTIVDQLTKGILGALGGCVRLLDTNNDGMPDELYIADNADPAQAVRVWRWNYMGWAASANGYNGPFTMGATLENGILANAITAGQIRAGTIISADGTSFYLNLDENVLRMSGIDSRFATEAANTDAKIADATDGIADHIDEVESSLTEKLIPLSELSDYIQVGNIGTESDPLFGVKIGKRDLTSAFKSVFTASALEFYENEVRTAFLSNQKLNTNTIRTAAMELVSSANMSDPASVDWLVTLDNGYTIKYVGGGS